MAIGRNVAALNQVLQAEIGEGIRFGVGVHCGTAIVGEIGFGAMRTFTYLGDAANVAARLEGLCKTFGCEAVVSNEVFMTAAVSAEKLPVHETALRGRSTSVLVHPIERLERLAGLVPMPDGVASMVQPRPTSTSA
jgi:adenylate cyclase